MPAPHPSARPAGRTPLPPPDRPRRLRDALAFYGVLAVLCACYLGWGLVAIGLSFVLPPRIGGPLGRRAIGTGFRFLLGLMERTGLVEFDLSELEPLRRARGLVVAPNHLSMIDVMLIVSHLPDAVCIMKAGLERNPAMGGGRLAGYIPNDAGLPVIRRAADALREGANLLVFPEGTRSPDGRVGPFHPGFALIARRARAPIQPVFIESNTRYLSKGWPIWRRPDFPLRYRARLGEAVTVAGPAEAFTENLHRQYTATLGEARP
ncbi:1-acyl-sn-glycerol-3-phosphate acyltransferases [Roseomonas rosea]|uniref:1-acyl-sn-glycerol-3-phosphate acyltransferases n=1 Tax=Muricoccus roseus TaxID=198092 RepID=A0A1M6I248_9PROT|nr:lysophospholipid acyltransferase family protein [Roseomonas rosea]SHJ28522.1 1-acyl-sn-glycerol-3-phosphate acyltransferases [Roseomonas rosea]